MTSQSSSLLRLLRQYGSNIGFLIVPPFLFLTNNFYSMYRIQDTSMVPTLLPGDIILVRKSDVFPHSLWRQWTSSSSSSSISSSSSTTFSHDVNHHCNDNINQEKNASTSLRVLALDAASGRPIGDVWTSRTYLKPPTIDQSNIVIVYRAVDAKKYPMQEYKVRRVIGLGGQMCRVPIMSIPPTNNNYHSALSTDDDGDDANVEQQQQLSTPTTTTTNPTTTNPTHPRGWWADKIIHIPAFALWVESDAKSHNNTIEHEDSNNNNNNQKQSSSLSSPNDNITDSCWTDDSREHGAICKNNVIGIAEAIVWPPSRWGKIPPPLSGTFTSRHPRAWWP